MSRLRTDVPAGPLLAANLAAVTVISVLDAVTPPGIVVGIFLLIPVVASAFSPRPRDVWLTWGAAVAGFVAAKLLGVSGETPPQVWLSNRAFMALTLLAGGVGALRLQTLRLEALAARDRAVRERELSTLLHALVTHELRAPLALADQTLEYVRGGAGRAEGPDEELLRAVHGRLRRGLDTVDQALTLVRTRLEGGSVDMSLSREEVARAVEAEARSFEWEVRLRGGRLELNRDVSGDGAVRIDLLVLLQSLSLVLNEALERVGPGALRIDVGVRDRAVSVDVSGPGRYANPDGLPRELDVFAQLLRSAGGELSAPADPERWQLRLSVPLR